MTSVPDRENKGGRASLQRRMAERARFLCMDEEFGAEISRFRLKWNSKHPQYSIRPVSSFGDLATDRAIYRNWYGSEWPEWAGKMWPLRLIEDVDQVANIDRWRKAFDAREFWDTTVDALSERYFPRGSFGDASEDAFDWRLWHPARLFILACLFIEPREVLDHVETLIRPQPLYPRSLAFPPSDVGTSIGDQRLGEVLFWRAFARTILSAQIGRDAVEHLLSDSERFGQLYALAERPHPNSVPPQERWWYLPLSPATSAKDVKQAAPTVASVMRQVYGPNRLDQAIRELSNAGKTQREIAELLGITARTVRTVLAKSRIQGTSGRTEESGE